MQATAALQTTRPASIVRPARKSVVVQAAARPEAPKQQKAALASLAAFAAAVLISAAPAPAHAEVRPVVCAKNPTAKICLRNSVNK